MSVLPIWAKQPKHKKTVVATNKGWEVEETGELLASHKGLDQKLSELYQEIAALSVHDPVPVPEPVVVPVPEPVVVVKKKRGPKPKNKDADANTAK